MLCVVRRLSYIIIRYFTSKKGFLRDMELGRVLPTNHFCILVPVPFWLLICTNFLQCSGAENVFFVCYLGQICIKFGAN